MKSSFLLHHLIFFSSQAFPDQEALRHKSVSLTYRRLAEECVQFSQSLIKYQIASQDRVALFLEKRFEFVTASFGTSCSGAIFVPINPILKPDQVEHILLDSEAKVLVTSADRYTELNEKLKSSTALQLVILVDSTESKLPRGDSKINIVSWSQFMDISTKTGLNEMTSDFSSRHMIDTDAVSILYTSGSTGRPKGVVLSHRNMVFGAKNVASYLENNPNDTLLAVLPLSFDAGFSQLTTAFFCGARAVLINYVVPNDILTTVIKEKVTGITAVPALWIQIAGLRWPQAVQEHLRYFANTGGRMPLEVLKKLRSQFPTSKPFLMYGLTESFRSTFLPPEEVDRRPDSIGIAIPNAEVLVLRPDGTPCEAKEPGELVHRGALVGLGYWKDPEKTAERYKPLPLQSGCRPDGIVNTELAVFSGDLVEKDDEGFLYYIGRNDEMIKTSGYRVSPMEIEEVVYNSGLAVEVAAFGIPHEALGQVIIVSVVPFSNEQPIDSSKNIEIKEKILNYCQKNLPLYMIPTDIAFCHDSHPRNQNGKIDRKLISKEYLKYKTDLK